jgi:hypothetical protein
VAWGHLDHLDLPKAWEELGELGIQVLEEPELEVGTRGQQRP